MARSDSDALTPAERSSPAPSRRSRAVEAPAEADVLTLLGIFLRRWYIIVPGLALAAVAAYLVNESVVPEYETEGTYMLSADAETAGEDAGDGTEAGVDLEGEAAASEGVALSGRAIAEVVQGDQVRAELLDQGLSAEYSVQFEGEGSLIRVEAVSADESEVVPTAEAVIEQVRAELEERQEAADVEAEQRIGIDVLAQPSMAVEEEVTDELGVVTERYRARGVLALVATPIEGEDANPYGANRATSQIIANVINSDAMKQQILVDPDIDYNVRQDRQDAAPFLYVGARGPDHDLVMQTYSEVRDSLEDELLSRQQEAGADPESWVSLQAIAEPTEASSLGGEGLRAALTVFALIAAMAFGGALLLESVLNAIRRRRRPEPRLPLLYSDAQGAGSELERMS